jgi:hypothetical protein
MEKKILIPTDFTIESLSLVKSVIKRLEVDQKYHIVLLHGLHATDSITELLFRSKSQLIQKLIDPEFEEACDIIKNKFDSQVQVIEKDIFSGFRQAAFDNYIEGNKINIAYIPSNFNFNIAKKSFDIVPFIQKSKVTINYIEWTSSTSVPVKGSLAEVFFNELASN